jgi:carboxyl-terminal processing protease
MKKLILLLFIIAPLLGSCKKEVLPTTGVTPAQARDTLYYLMRQWYYWYNFIPSINKEDYADPYLLLEAMRYKLKDHWSKVIDYDASNAMLAGGFVGHGISIGLDQSDKARIAMIYNKSPLYPQGVRRGWIVKKINNFDPSAVLISRDAAAYNEMFGASSTSVTNTFLFQKPDGSEVTISSTKASFTINTVLLYDTLQLRSGVNNEKVVTGHLVLESFWEPTESELATAFTWFQSVGVKDLILDLRYNTGGILNMAQLLASYIAGNGLAGKVFATLQYNDKLQAQNSSYKFITTAHPLSVSRIIVITTRSTASASECVMNGLSPHMSVISVGDTTYGKPVGMNGWPCGKKYFFWPVTFRTVNSLNQGDFYDGFIPNKIALDDITHDFNDRHEISLSEAIRYLETGAFSAKGAFGASTDFRRSVQFSERPSWTNNTFVREK